MRAKALLVGVAVLLAATTAACGSKSNGSGGGASTSTSTSTGTTTTGSSAATGSPITIAALCSCSGPFGQYLVAGRDVAESWVKTVDASGGINGHQVVLKNYDDGSVVGTAETDAKEAVSSHADVILDLSEFDAVWESTVDAAKIPVVGGELNSTLFSTDSNFYASGQTPDSSTYALVATAKASGASNLGNLYCVEAPSCKALVADMPSIGTTLGIPNKYSASIAFTAPNYTAQCLAAKSDGVKSLAILDASGEIIKVAGNCDQQGYDPTYVSLGTGFALTMAKAPGTSKSLWMAFADLPFFSTAAPVKAMSAAVQQYYPGLQSNDLAWSQYAVQAWTGGLLVEAAVKAAGTGDVSATSVKSGLDSLTNETLDGWSPPLTFTAGQTHKADCWFTAQVENGTPTVTNNGADTCETS